MKTSRFIAIAVAFQALAGGPIAAAQSAHPAPGGSPATYQVLPRLSQASYSVDEVFLRENNRLFTAVGVTPGVSGEIALNQASPGESRIVEMVVDLSQLKSDSDRRDRAIRRKYLESDRFPFARLTNVRFVDPPERIIEGRTFHYALEGDLEVHGVTRRTTWQGEATLARDTLRGVARAEVLMSSFGIEVPNLLSLRAADAVKVEIRYVAAARRP
jgi:polyisoprenoid-binding protein YceI